jgi:hypothetical protein
MVQLGRLALQGQRLNIMTEEVGGGGAPAAQKAGLLAQYISPVGV